MRLFGLYSVLMLSLIVAMMFFPLIGLAALWGSDSAIGSAVSEIQNVVDEAQQKELSQWLLIFGFLIMISEFIIIYKKCNCWNLECTRIVSITLIVIAGLFLIAAGFSNDQIAPVIALLGTIVGYLLGKSS